MSEFNASKPFRSSSALEHGLSRRTLTGKRFHRLYRDCYVSSDQPVDFQMRVRAALEMVPGAHGLSHNSAIAWVGGCAPDTPDIHLAVPHRMRTDLPGIRTHRCRNPPLLWTRRGVRFTAPQQSFVDLAASTDLVELVVVGDSIARRTSLTPTDLVAFARQSHASGIGRARRASELVRSRVDSPQESRSRMLIVLARLPEPDVDLRFFNEEGELLRRIDMGYEGIKLGVEYDGRQHMERKVQWAGDLRRQEYFDHLKWQFIKLIAPDIWTTPGETVERVRIGLADRGVKLPPPSDEWHLHFPGRGGFDIQTA